MKIAVVTGASSGMGREFVLAIQKEYGEQLEEIWVLARRRERLEELQSECSLPLRVFAIDLQNQEQYQCYLEALQEEKPRVGILVNGAGMGKIGEFSQISSKGNLSMIDLNCGALTKITYDTLPYMKTKSKIVHFASGAAFLPQAGFGVYAASKAYVLSFSQALCWELKKKGIHVMAVCPGPVNTEFFQTAEEFEAMAGYKKFFLADPKRVVKKAMKDLKQGREISVYGFSMQVVRIAAKLLPHSLLLRIMNCKMH